MEENKNLTDEPLQEEPVEAESVESEEAKATEETKGTEETDTAEEAKESEGTDATSEEAESEKTGLFGKKKKKSAKVLELELEKSEAKVAELTDRYQRLMAEFENARKRSAKEKSHMYDVGAKEVLEKLLPVVDNFERGLASISEEEKSGAFAQGIEKIYQQLMTSLDEIGVKPMNAKGTEFDPNLHNAVMHEENEEMGENLVAEEFQKGYMYKESVLRHAMVKVVN